MNRKEFSAEKIEHDFNRDVWCLLGLPFDAITLKQTLAEILSATTNKKPCFLSTPNLNFLCAAQTDSEFRDSVINSDLSIADGFPIVVVAKLLGIPIPERVAGSDLIEQLHIRTTGKPLKIFFFGGEPGVGEWASQRINEKPSGLQAVGHYVPGFGTVEEMSNPEIINYINQYDIDFLIVSLGAKKGQAWIEKNRHQLNSPIISHLGAVINFFAGTVERAPVVVQCFGLEWLWRIYQEPTLWRRYYNDGLVFMALLLYNILPYRLWLSFKQPKIADPKLGINVFEESKTLSRIVLTGICSAQTIMPLRELYKKLAQEKHDVILDLDQLISIDSAFLGLCLVLSKHLKAAGRNLKLINPNNDLRRIINWQKMHDLLA
jgi:N-acetylglucosaminyldiphosphoundecaprenol N-acetyl-beta-D-mannosaminyltransferase